MNKTLNGKIIIQSTTESHKQTGGNFVPIQQKWYDVERALKMSCNVVVLKLGELKNFWQGGYTQLIIFLRH